MKMSQYILLSFASFLVTAVLVLFIDSKGKENYATSKKESTILGKDLGDFSVIVAEKEANIRIKNDSINTIGATLLETDSVLKLPDYKVINDTLFISKSAYSSKTTIYCNAVKTVIGLEKANILFKDYKTDSLSVYVNKSKVRGWLVNKPIQYVNVDASNGSDISVIVDQPILSCKLKIDSSFVRLHGDKSKIVNLIATIKNKANMYLKSIEKSDIDCDSLSTYQIYNYKNERPLYIK